MDKKLTEEELQRYKKEAEMTPYSEPSYRMLRLLSHIEQLKKSNKFKDTRWEQDLHAKWEWADVAYDWRVKFENAWKENKQQTQEIEKLRKMREIVAEAHQDNLERLQAKAQRLEIIMEFDMALREVKEE
jgi:hypothetical protein